MLHSTTVEVSEDNLMMRCQDNPEKWPLDGPSLDLSVSSTLHADVPEFVPGQAYTIPLGLPSLLSSSKGTLLGRAHECKIFNVLDTSDLKKDLEERTRLESRLQLVKSQVCTRGSL